MQAGTGEFTQPWVGLVGRLGRPVQTRRQGVVQDVPDAHREGATDAAGHRALLRVADEVQQAGAKPGLSALAGHVEGDGEDDAVAVGFGGRVRRGQLLGQDGDAGVVAGAEFGDDAVPGLQPALQAEGAAYGEGCRWR